MIQSPELPWKLQLFICYIEYIILTHWMIWIINHAFLLLNSETADWPWVSGSSTPSCTILRCRTLASLACSASLRFSFSRSRLSRSSCVYSHHQHAQQGVMLYCLMRVTFEALVGKSALIIPLISHWNVLLYKPGIVQDLHKILIT